MGGAQPLAVTMNDSVCLIADVDLTRLRRRQKERYLDELESDVDRAIDRAVVCTAEKQAVSIGVNCNAIVLLEQLVRSGVVPDVLTDQTSAHDPLTGYVPDGYDLEQAAVLRANAPAEYQN